jgi:mono/diheme cytochrome c family protein
MRSNPSKENEFEMKFTSKAMVIIAAGMLAVASTPTWAADGASLYKTKCSTCHGANGEGKPAMKAPELKGTALSADKIAAMITTGDPAHKAPHTKAISGLDGDQAKAIAEFVKTLK